MPCPWDAFEPASLRFCEVPVCSLVTEPANTWSNVGFLVAALWVLRRARQDDERLAGTIGWTALATGLGSTAFHATSTLAGQLVDQNAMFLESSLFIALNVARWRRTTSGVGATFLVALLPVVGLLVAVRDAGIVLFAVHVTVFLGIEALLAFRTPRRTRYGALLMVGLLFAVSWGIWWLDKLGLACDPDNHVINGHAVWHLLGALSFPFWYRHYAQFQLRRAA